MNKILISTIALAIISGCSNTSEVKPQIVEKPQATPQMAQQPVVTTKVEVKKEDPFEVAKQSCLANNAQGCINFGYILIDDENYKLAKTAFSMAYDYGDKDGGMRGNYYVECLEKNAESCYMLGVMLAKGEGGKQDYKLARVAYQQAIDLGDTDSLGGLAHLYSKGLGGEKSQVKATKLFEASCNAGTTGVNYENCYNAGNHYYFGQGVKQNYFKSVEYYKKSCNGVYAYGCDALGLAYYNGEGVKQSNSMAKKYFGKACDGKVEEGCNHYAKLNQIVKRSTSQSRRAYRSSSYVSKGTSNVIESRIDGDFEGWEGETVVKLMNGQIWQQSSYHYYYHYAYMPEVLIYKSGGTYKMKVDGVDTDVSVIRLK